MGNYFAQIAAPRMSGGVDFSGLNEGIDSIAAARQRQRQNALQQRQMDMQEQEFAANQAQRQRQATREDAEMFGRQAAAIDRLEGPQRAIAYQRLLAQHPNRAGLTPEYLDPVNGPKLIMAEAGQFRDPREDQLMDLKVQQARKSLAESGATGQPRVGLQPVYGRDEQGNTVILQPSASGEMVRARVPDGVTIDPGLVAGARAQQSAIGKAQGEAASGLGKAAANVEIIRDVVQKLRTHPGRAEATGWGSVLPDVAFTGRAGRGFIDLFNQAQGGAFLDAFEILKGGGQITEIEGQKATQARLRMSRASTKEDFDAALDDFLAAVESGYQKLQQKAGGAMPSAPAANPGAWSIQKVE